MQMSGFREALGRQKREESHLTLVFARRSGKWLMVQDQNTPTRG
jgi:hypothetical protein